MKLIMVDLDGTLFDTKDVNFSAYQEAVSLFGYSIEYDYFCKYCNGKHYLDFLPLITTDDKIILSQIHKRKKEAYSKYLHKAIKNEQLLDILQISKTKYKIALVTTASKKNTYELLDFFNIASMFDLILTHDDIEKTKPDPEGFFKAMQYFNAKPSECLIFEDSDVGVKAASETGASVFVVKGYS